ncbi:hypothetical protein AB1N83_013738 [Pleurotus pulmonarius]
MASLSPPLSVHVGPMLQDCPPTTTSSPNVIMTKHANEQRTTRSEGAQNDKCELDVSCTGEMKERGARNDECSGTVVNDVFR